MKEEKNNDWNPHMYYGSAKYQFIDAIMKESGVPNSMFDDVVEEYEKQVHVGTARLATTSTETRNMMLLLC